MVDKIIAQNKTSTTQKQVTNLKSTLECRTVVNVHSRMYHEISIRELIMTACRKDDLLQDSLTFE